MVSRSPAVFLALQKLILILSFFCAFFLVFYHASICLSSSRSFPILCCLVSLGCWFCSCFRCLPLAFAPLRAVVFRCRRCCWVSVPWPCAFVRCGVVLFYRSALLRFSACLPSCWARLGCLCSGLPSCSRVGSCGGSGSCAFVLGWRWRGCRRSRSAPRLAGVCAVNAALPFPIAPGSVIAVAGSRSVPESGGSVVARSCFALAAAGAIVSVGCCVGIDEFVISYYPAGALRVSAAFGPDGAGAGRFSALHKVSWAKLNGSHVDWWAGGSASVPLPARLSARTAAVVCAANAGAVVFFASPQSRGSLLAAHSATLRGLPVVAFSLGFTPSLLPSLGVGRWVNCGGAGVWAEAWRWESAQTSMF